MATYVGRWYAPRKGTYEARLDSAVFADLAATIVRNGFFQLPTDLGLALDAPVTRITVVVQDPATRMKRVVGSFPDYEYLWPLADRLDSLAAAIAWEYRSADTLTPPW
jgi:hypothetical protein